MDLNWNWDIILFQALARWASLFEHIKALYLKVKFR